MTIQVVNKRKPDVSTTMLFKADTLTRIYCGRGSALGNPFPMLTMSRDEVCDAYKIIFKEAVHATAYGGGNPRQKAMYKQLNEIITAAKEGDVALECYCAPARCHCDTIKSYADGATNNAT